jgi:pimeloyl-ACP methyl ester carboxylesterase
MKTIQTKNVVFITGAFVTHKGWDNWKAYFESKGYKTLAPAWPFKDADPAELRNRQPNDTALASLTLSELVDHYANIIKKLEDKPIIIGHSLGGLITQILLSRGLGVAGIVFHSVPPQGIIPYEFSFLKSTWRALGLFTSASKTYLMSFDTWQYAFTNGMTLAEQKKAYEENTIPESKTVTKGGLSSAAKVDFDKPRGPLLIIAGSKDNIIPASLNQRNFNAYKNNPSLTEFRLVEGRNHFVLGLPTWKEDADYVLNWIANH